MIDPALAWAQKRWPTGRVSIAERVPLAGGVSGAAVERIRLVVAEAESVEVVIKRTAQSEAEVLTMLAELGDPVIPLLLDHGQDERGPWILLPWYAGRPMELIAEPPAEVFRTVARIHRRFLDRSDHWPAALERIDSAFCRRALTEFLPDTVRRASPEQARDIGRRALDLADRLATDPCFMAAPAGFPSTLLHGDLYGLNVLQGGPTGSILIDWNSARIGPAMFDVAMTQASLDSPGAHAYFVEWNAVGGPQRDVRAEFAWASTLINCVFAPIVADRGALDAASRMLTTAAVALTDLQAELPPERRV